MQRYRYISHCQNCTFGKAEKQIYWHFESIDNQCVYLYQNHSDFTGKEKDVETGYGYFGARYIDQHLTTLFLSVDPMADKYPSINPYAYCMWNPIKLVDPDGRDFEKIIDHEKKTITIRAQFYCSDNNKQYQSFIQKSADIWNSCSFVVAIPNEDGVMEDYTVSFDINNGHGPLNNVLFLSDDEYNCKHPKEIESGGITDGKTIDIRNYIINNQILSHEMGHCLGITDNEIREDCLMFASNTGNVHVKRLCSIECIQLLEACGLNFGGRGNANISSRCVSTTIIGNTSDVFWNTVLTERNIKNNDTNKFVQ